MLAKPKGGDRPICLVPLLVKLWESVNGDTILAWETDRIGFWDDAVKGSSVLRAAGLRRLQAETASLFGEEFCFLLWDAEKF